MKIDSGKSTILLTGANGYLGQVLRSNPVDWSWKTCDTTTGQFDHVGCFTEIPDSILRSVDAIVHMADMRLQFLKAKNVQENINRHKVFMARLRLFPNIKKIIFCSSCSVYGQSSQLLNEESEILLNSFYAESKFQTEQFVSQHDNFCILRFGTAYGVSSALRADLLVNNLMLSALQKKDIHLYDRLSYRPFVNSKDFCAAIIFSVMNNLSGTFNVAQTNLSKNDLILELAACIPDIENFIKTTDEVTDPRNYKVTSEKFVNSGFQFAIDFKTGVQHLYGYLNSSD